jgi:hypothetical protein
VVERPFDNNSAMWIWKKEEKKKKKKKKKKREREGGGDYLFIFQIFINYAAFT